MATAPFKANIGVSRISGSLDTTHADFTRSVRSSMQNIVKEYVRWIQHMEGNTAEVLQEALDPTMQLSKELVPVDTGDLKESAFLEVSNFRGNPRVDMGYGKGGHPDYAVMVHENPDMYHKAPTQYKFLQKPLEEDFENVKQRVVDGLKKISGT